MKFLKMLALSCMLALAACGGGDPIEPTMSKEVSDFSFVTQDGETLSLDDLKGKWWIADFVFTNCKTVCIPMTANMSVLQDRLKEERIDIQLVTFTVDPERDTPEVLKEYGEQYDADFDTWTFLTGYDYETIEDLSVNSFASPLVAPTPGSDQFTHGTRFYLVNPEGVVIKSYNGAIYDELEEIMEDVRKIRL